MAAAFQTDSNQVQVANLGNLEDHAEGVACHVAYHAAVVGRVAGHVAPGQARQVAGQAGVVVAMDVHLVLAPVLKQMEDV